MSDKVVDPWEAWSKHVLLELDRLSGCTEDVRKEIQLVSENIRKDISQISSDIAVLKFKAGVWGALGGAIPAILLVVAYFLKAAS
jgi:hypothetical protein